MAQVELKDFIQNVLVEVAQGIRGANETLKDPDKGQFHVFNLRSNRGDSSKIPGIKFDVALSAATQQKDKAGFFVTLVSMGGGASTEQAKGGETAHRIQFEVGINSDWL